MVVLSGVIAVAGGLSGAARAAEGTHEFPMRVRYPDVQVISTADLVKQFDKAVIVDVRTKYEFDTLHIKDAVLLPLEIGFGEKAAALRTKVGDKLIVFYCNGKTCHKSYEAALLAQRARVNNVVAYDAGIFDWAKAQPERTVLRGRSPIQPTDLISGDDFHAHQLDPKTFETRVGADSIVLDVRDKRQRDSALFPFKEKRAQLDETKKLDAVIDEAKAQKKTLLVYDEVGKQVQWFQYHLESRGLKDYYFMKGGAQGYFDATLGKVVLGGEDKVRAQARQ
jgi:rhodanese-related sulfurtransferase